MSNNGMEIVRITAVFLVFSLLCFTLLKGCEFVEIGDCASGRYGEGKKIHPPEECAKAIRG